MLNNRGQVGSTLTWLVATVIIVLILGISIFVAVPVVTKSKNIQGGDVDLLTVKTFSGFLKSDGNYAKLKQSENLEKNNGGELAKKISNFVFPKEKFIYPWIGFHLDRTVFPYPKNDFFSNVPTGMKMAGPDIATIESGFKIELFLEENKKIVIINKKR
jgi:hypothetical protein